MGSIYWNDFLTELKRVGYAGDLSFETYAQYTEKRIPKALIPDFVALVGKIGNYFREELQK